MKYKLLPLLILCLISGHLIAQNDTMYVMRAGVVIGKYKTTEIDSIVFYKPAESGTAVTDYDGNVYATVTIGSQTWMAENLKTTHYADGTPIPYVEGNINWGALTATDQAYCWYNDDSISYASTYGALYTWPAAMKGTGNSEAITSGIQGVCPDGWHVPSDEEWSALESYMILHGYNYDGTTSGNKIGKSLAATSEWFMASAEGAVGNSDYPNYRNQSGFSALPGGFRDSFGACNYIKSEGYWWSATEYSKASSHYRLLAYYANSLLNFGPLCFYKELGFSVRCVAD